MPSATRKKKQTINFDDYLTLLMSLEGEALKEWNREGLRRSRLLVKEESEKSRSNIEKYLLTPGAEQALAEQKKHTGEVTLKWEIDMTQGECRLRVIVGEVCAELGLREGYSVLDRATVKRFITLINEHLIASSLSLFEASAIYTSEKIEKSNPRSWRRRFTNEQRQRLDALTGNPQKVGRPGNTTKNCLRKEDETNELNANVRLAVRNLYYGKSVEAYHCPKHGQSNCPGHDIEEITNELTAGYLNRSAGTLRNQLSKAKLKFPDLKKEALKSITD